MSGSSTNNNWTILTSEETAAETLGPLAEGTEHKDEHRAPTEAFGAKPTDGAEGQSVEDHSMSVENTTKQSEDHDGCAPGFHIPTSSKVTSSAVPYGQPEAQPVDPAQCSSEPDSFSDSYTHLSPSPDENPASPLTTETLGHLDLVMGPDDDTQLRTLEQEFQRGGEESDLPHLEKTQESTVETEVVLDKTETTASEGESEVRRRRSLLAALEQIGRTDEEEEAEEDFQLPQREEDTGLTLNKCILGAVILLGLGTIFFSGVFMDLDEESDYATRELNDSEAPVKQEWLNPDVAPPVADAVTAELLNKLAKGNEQIAMLEAQLQAQNDELKVAKGQAAEGTVELLQQPVLQKEVEKLKRELESVAVLQKELETLRSTVTELKLSPAASSSSSGQTGDNRQMQNDQGQKKDKHDMGEWKDVAKSERTKEKKHLKDGGKIESKDNERKKDKPKERREGGKHKKPSEEPKEWKKEKSKTGEDGVPWEVKNKTKELTDKSDKKSKHDHFNDDRQRRSKEEKRDLKEGKHHGEWHKGNKEKQWRKETDGHEDAKDKYEREDWKGRGEKKEWRKDKEWKSKNGKENGERKQWSENNWKNNKDEKKWKKRNDRKQLGNNEEVWKGDYKEKKRMEEWHEDKSSSDKHKHMGSDRKDHKWAERNPTHSHRKPSPQQPEYWVHQRDRLQHSTKPLQLCNSLDACAQAEGVRPVLFTEFEDILQTYLSKAQTAGVDDSQIDELRKLATESFMNGAFVHDQMSFRDYVEDLGDILEDLVEGEESDVDQDSALEDEMEGFEREVMQKFMLSESGKQGRVKEEWRKESGRGRG